MSVGMSQPGDHVEVVVPDRARPNVQYAPSTANYDIFNAEVAKVTAPHGVRVCDLGGGSNPALSVRRIVRQELDYVIVDIDGAQLAKAPPEYSTLEGDILERGTVERLIEQGGPFDLVFSRWAAEHMRDGRTFHENVYALLRPGGAAVHLFPTLFAVPFTINWLLSDRLSRLLLFTMTERASKFPAHYSWCRGPTHKQLARLESVGFEVDRYVGFFGHGFFQRLPPAQAAYRRLADALVRHPVPLLGSFAVVVLKRPES
ncbi:MAG TPA: class I SAM-dependent methyltransferase [Solirubrobacteraceae bacterium]|jgi:2-polyprenyl-3-methyl-5-hydroxy-6-metoxy-1,4-benzoquinol methylase|nr:class I SAM-dependent methyltransferase [Solirubrobacteraceae bacterium]